MVRQMTRHIMVLVLYIICNISYAKPFVNSDPPTQTVTACSVYLDDANAYDTPTLLDGSCHVDLKDVTPGSHTLKAKYVRDDIWGRTESVQFSNTITFSRELVIIEVPPINLTITKLP